MEDNKQSNRALKWRSDSTNKGDETLKRERRAERERERTSEREEGLLIRQ